MAIEHKYVEGDVKNMMILITLMIILIIDYLYH